MHQIWCKNKEKSTISGAESAENGAYNQVVGTIKETLGQRIARLRGKTSQEDFSEAAGIPRRTLQNIENAKTGSPGIDKLQKIATALGVSVDYLQTGVESNKDPLPEWAAEIGSRLQALEKKMATSSPASIPKELLAAWESAGPEMRLVARWMLTDDDDLLEKVADQVLTRVKRKFEVLCLTRQKKGRP